MLLAVMSPRLPFQTSRSKPHRKEGQTRRLFPNPHSELRNPQSFMPSALTVTMTLVRRCSLLQPRFCRPARSDHNPRQFVCLLPQQLNRWLMQQASIHRYFQPEGSFVCLFFYDPHFRYELCPASRTTGGSVVSADGSSSTDELACDRSAGNGRRDRFAELQHLNREPSRPVLQLLCSHDSSFSDGTPVQTIPNALQSNPQSELRNPQCL